MEKEEKAKKSEEEEVVKKKLVVKKKKKDGFGLIDSLVQIDSLKFCESKIGIYEKEHF